MKPSLGGSITVRISARSLKLLRARARQSRQTTSEVVRELVERQLQPWPAGLSAWDLSREWVGSVDDAALPHGARVGEALADWKPDRR